MKIENSTLPSLAAALAAERKRQQLSREAAAAACGVSVSFIRDAESSPQNCSLGKLVQLINGLGLSLQAQGFQITAQANTRRSKQAPLRADYGVSEAQIVLSTESAADSPTEAHQP